MVAAVCDKRGLKAEAVEFLIMAGKKEEAFVLVIIINIIIIKNIYLFIICF